MKARGLKMADGGWQTRRIMDCGGKRGATPLSQAEWFTNRMEPLSAQKLRRRCALPAQSKIWRHEAVLLCFLFSIFCFRVSGQSYSIDWFKIVAGGGASTNGQFTVRGTIGQPDASAALTGGNYSLTGGFWSLFAVQTPGAPGLRIFMTSANSVVLAWPASATSYTLQQNPNQHQLDERGESRQHRWQ